MKKKVIKIPKQTILRKDGKEYLVHPELKDDDIFQITATGIEHGFKTIYQKEYTFEDLIAISKYYSKFEDLESISNDITKYLDKKQVELANRGDTIELYINISPEEEICLILDKIFADADLLKEKNEELLNEILQLQATINLLKEDLRKKIEGLKDCSKLANRLKNEKDDLDRKLRELEKKLKKKDELIEELKEDVLEYNKVNQNLSSKCERLAGELSENEEQQQNVDEYKLKLKELENQLMQQEDEYKNKLEELEDKLRENEENDDEKIKILKNKLIELEEKLKKQKELNKKLKLDKKNGDVDLLNQLEELEKEYQLRIKELEDDLQKQKDLNKTLRLSQKDGNESLLKELGEMEEEYQNKLKELETKLDKLKQENKKLKSNPKISEYENKISELEEQIAKQIEIIKQLKQKLKNQEDDYENQLQELRDQIKKMQGQNNKFQSDKETMIEEYEERINELENQLKKSKEENKELKSQLHEQKGKNKTPEYYQLKSELNKLKSEIREKDKIIDSLENIKKAFEDKEKNGSKKIRKTSITKIITKTKRVKSLGPHKYISITPTKNYKFLLSSDDKSIINTSNNNTTNIQNEYLNSKLLSEQKNESFQNNETNETESNSYILKKRLSQSRRNLNTIFNNINQILSEKEVIDNSDVIERENELNLIKDKLGLNNLNLFLLYKATRDGDDADIFHDKVGNTKNNITFIKTRQGIRFGGYTSQSWDGVNVFKQDDEAFIFSLTKLKTYDVNQKENAIWCYPSYGPVFGAYQIDIFDKCLTKDLNKTGLKGLGYNTTENFELNNGEKNFIVDELEVYGIQI